MASGGQVLDLSINADASGLVTETQRASQALESLQADARELGTTDVDLTIDANTTAAERDLADVESDARALDDTEVEISADLERSRIDRDLASLNRVLDGLERRKASPDVDLDITQLLRDEKKVRKAIDDLEARRAEVDVGLNVDTSGLAQLSALADDLDVSIGGVAGGVTNLIPMLGRLGTSAGAAGAAAGVLALVTATVALQASWVRMAADVETTIVSLDSLTDGMGEQMFGALQDFAAETPYALDEVTAAARRLLGAGIEMGDIEGVLTDLGNAASAYGVSLEQVTGIFSQMLLKGRVTNEELLQLAEAGVPAASILADALGVTTAQIEEMASAGQLGADAVNLLAEAMGSDAMGAMDAQAETLNGKLSTLNDTFAQIGQTLGAELLPIVSAAVTAFQYLADGLLWVTQKAAGFFDVTEAGTRVLGKMFPPAELLIRGIGWLGDAMGEGEEDSEDFAEATLDTTGAIQEQTVTVDELNSELETLISNFSTLKDDALSIEEGVVALDDAMTNVGDSLSEFGVSLDETTVAGANNRIAFGEALQALDDYALAVYQETGSQEAANKAWQQGYDDLIALAQGYGLSKTEAHDLADELRLTPDQITTEWDLIVNQTQLLEAADELTRLEERLAGLREERNDLTVELGIAMQEGDQAEIDRVMAEIYDTDAVIVDVLADIDTAETTIATLSADDSVVIDVSAPGAEAAGAAIETAAADQEATITVDLQGATEAGNDLDDVADRRDANIYVQLPNYYLAEQQLDNLARNRSVTITANVRRSGGGGGGGSDEALLLGATTLGAPIEGGYSGIGAPSRVTATGGATEPSAATTTILQPRRDSVAVYIDGASVAQHLETHTRRVAVAAAGSRRRP